MSAPLPIAKTEFEARLNETQTLLRSKGLDGLIAFSSYAEREGHVCYLTNHRISFPNVMSHMGFGHAALVLPLDGAGTLVAPLGVDRANVVGIRSAKVGFDMIADLSAAVKENRLDGKKIGVAGMDVVPAEYYFRLQQALLGTGLENANSVLEEQRIIKSPAEIELLRRAAHIADVGLQAGMEAAREGATEHDVELAARRAALDAGADFIPRVRVASGKAPSPLGWPMSKPRWLEKGDIVYLDLIGWYGNYGFDNSRVRVIGPANAGQKKFLDTVADATQWMVEVLKPGPVEFPFTGARGCNILAIAHGIGLEVCENPWITLGAKAAARPGMVICIEPSVVSPEFGTSAIEDTVLVTEKGTEVLTQCPRVFWE